ncbi:kinase-like domain-containing protein [Umbelopsis sp. PMI_123]|nr:kinase-like domain-containing protein [Umbelopsis sp. PMI_123]
MYSQNMKRTKSGADMLFDKMRHEQQKSDQLAAVHFLEATLDCSLSSENLHNELKDGVLLCNLVNKLRPGTIKQVGNKDLPFVKMDNITRFLQGARQLGLNTAQLFETIDLFEAKDMGAVINTILTIEKLHTKRKPSEPIIKCKPSVCQNENQQDDTDPQTKEDVDRSIEGPSTECKETPDREVENLNIQENNNIEATVNEESPISPVQDQELDSSILKSDEENLKSVDEIENDEENEDHSRAVDHLTVQRDDRLHKAYLANLKQGDRFAEAQSHYPDVRDIFAYPPSSFSKHKKLENLDIKIRRRQSLSALDGDVYETGVRPPRSPLRPSYYHTKKGSASMSACSYEHKIRSRSPKNTHKTTMDSGYSTMSRRRPISPYFTAEDHVVYSPATNSRKSLDNLTTMKSTVDIRSSFDEQRLMPSRSTPAASKERLNRKIDEERIKLIQAITDEGIKEKLSLRSATNQIIAQYQLGNCIGRGQFGSVYRALNLKNGEVVAVKRIKIDDEDILADIMREVELLKAVSHPNVVRYHGFIQKSGYMNIVLEYVENGSLLSTLKAFGAFPEKLVASFCIKILSGLEYLHANQVVHCDLKAANILTTKTGDVKLTDFGVSLNLKIKESDTGRVAGTPNWMAPEVIELRGASVKSDIWSLGCTMIELLTGKPPYADLIAMSALFRIVEDDYPPLPSKISNEMSEFLLCCFQKNPDDRPTASELRLHSWLQNNQPYNMIRLNRPPRMHYKSLQLLHNIFNLHDNSQSESDSVHSNDKLYNKCTSTPARYKSLDDIPYFRAYGGYAQSVDPADMDDEYISHCFVKTDFSKQMDCKVCGEAMNRHVLFCEVCALICHQHCRPNALSCPPKINKQQPSYDVST